MFQNYNKLFIKITLLLIQLTGAFENNTAGACKSLITNRSTTYTCKYNNKTLNNCINPIEGTEVLISCNQFYEASNLEGDQTRACTKNGWDELDDVMPECYAICGLKPARHISNSSSSQGVLDYPWHVGIYDSTKHFLCGGTIIEMNIILTAANCVDRYVNNSSDEMLWVASGKYYIGYNDDRDKFAQFSEVQSIKVPDEYNGQANLFEFNIAILILKTSFVSSVVVKPVCVDLHRLPHDVYFGNNGIVPGWGSSYHGNGKVFSEELKEIKILYIENNNCSTKIKKEFIKYMTPDKICVANLDNEISVCNGDTGGGLVYENARTNRFYIRGVVSWTPTIDEDTLICDPNQFSISTSVSSHRSFIRNYTDMTHPINTCHFLDAPPQGKYILTIPSDINWSLGNRTNKAADKIPPYVELTLICNDGYTPVLPHSDHLYCAKYGTWNPNTGRCGRTNITKSPELDPKPPIEISSGAETPGFNYITTLVYITITVVVSLIVALAVLRLKFKKETKLRKEMKLSGLTKFQYGDLKKFNPELGIGGQAELLPYNYEYEFPIHKLEMGKQLGSGAFGVVMKAYALEIIPNEKKTKVAVKTVKDIDDYFQIKSLISELKLMIHLGIHLNVVKLLGACTHNITKRELFVILEYCQYGNLCNYLLRNRLNYINQIDSVTGNIDYTLDSEDLQQQESVRNTSSTHYKKSWSESKFINSQKSKNSIQKVNTKDLISWSFQIAHGMDYLSSRMIIHGDLAGRNILLADNNIVKICDFGLAKRLYHTNYYKTSKDCLLPFKWMAFESFRDGVFSISSDIWSYGIVLWELFSLAETPHPGIEDPDSLYNKLMNGYKMDSPPYAPKKMYKIMCNCWNMDSKMRPSFNKLASQVGLLLEENVRQHYIDLNDPYLLINTQRFKAGQKDYLKMLNDKNYQQKTVPNNYISLKRYVSSVGTSGKFNVPPTDVPGSNRDIIPNEEKLDSYTVIENIHL